LITNGEDENRRGTQKSNTKHAERNEHAQNNANSAACGRGNSLPSFIGGRKKTGKRKKRHRINA